MSRLPEKVAIVTGASKGIGAGIAPALGAAGARVAANYSSDREGAERVAQTITDNGSEAIAVGADVSKAADVARLFKEVHSAFGRLDVLLNNAGVFRFGAFAEITEENQHGQRERQTQNTADKIPRTFAWWLIEQPERWICFRSSGHPTPFFERARIPPQRRSVSSWRKTAAALARTRSLRSAGAITSALAPRPCTTN
jgi:NAD(P)-dependent dehydrogenase (short-subunit alcohol dehydrogenase family)